MSGITIFRKDNTRKDGAEITTESYVISIWHE